MSPARRPRVVIVGAGFGGLAAARGLAHADVDVTLVDRHNFHLFQPLLYQVASGLLDPSQIAYPVRAVARRQRNCRFLLAAATGVDVEGRTLHTTAGALRYDHLVLAVGGRTDFFGHADFAERSTGLKTLADALQLRSRLLESFEAASHAETAAERERLMTIAVVGGGPTGIEYTGAALELLDHVLPRDYPELDLRPARVVLIEAADRVLGGFAAPLAARARRYLEQRGATILTGLAVERMTAAGVALAGGREVGAGVVLWTAGVRAESLVEQLGPVDRSGRLPVLADLTVAAHPDISVIGDAARVEAGAGALPMLAPVAIQAGAYTAARISGSAGGPFRYRDRGIMAAVGRNCAVVQTQRLKLSGFAGWLAWLGLHLVYIIGFRNRAIVLFSWGWNYLFQDRPVRLITVESEPVSEETERHATARTR